MSTLEWMNEWMKIEVGNWGFSSKFMWSLDILQGTESSSGESMSKLRRHPVARDTRLVFAFWVWFKKFITCFTPGENQWPENKYAYWREKCQAWDVTLCGRGLWCLTEILELFRTRFYLSPAANSEPITVPTCQPGPFVLSKRNDSGGWWDHLSCCCASVLGG